MSDSKQRPLPGVDGSGIIRVEKRERFLTIENETIRDKRLSFGARGLLSFLLSHQDKWEIKVPQLIKQSPAGRDAIYSLLRELERFRYLLRKKRHGHRGRISWLSIVYETPQGPPMTDEELRQLHAGRPKKLKGDTLTPPLTGFPYTVEPDTAEPDTVEPDTVEPDTVEPDTAKPEVIIQEEPSEESSSDLLPSEESSPALSAPASSSEENRQKLSDDDAARCLALYERATGNRARESDRQFLTTLGGRPPTLIQAGIALSAIRAREAGTHINSLNYCRGTIEELSEPHVLPSYLEYVLNKFEQLFPRSGAGDKEGE
jgi:hypothetical protein